jgi:hypothetical protein
MTHPIYYGCPNLHEYFSKNAYTRIDITRPQEAFQTIEQIIKENKYEKSLGALGREVIKEVIEAKNQILNTYNFFPCMEKFCKKQQAKNAVPITLYPQEYFYKNDSILKKAFHKLKNFSRRPH